MKARMTIAEFNAHMAAQGMTMEIVKGRGYFYFTTLAPMDYASASEYVYAFNQLTPAEWFERACAVWADFQEGQAHLATIRASGDKFAIKLACK